MATQPAPDEPTGDDPGVEAGPAYAELPPAVRARVVSLAAEAAGALAPEVVPAALKKVVSFAPARRARLAGARIAEFLDTDDRFRELIAHQVEAGRERGARRPEGAEPDPVEVAAYAFIARTAGWRADVEAVSGELESREVAVLERRAEERATRLQQQLDKARSELAHQRDTAREQVADLKRENADLRRKLGETRVLLRAAEERGTEALARADSLQEQQRQTAATSDAEARRLRARIDQLERESGVARRKERAGRDAETVRTRLLLDTVIDAAQGLRRELALPAVDGSPADLVAADEGIEGQRVSSGHGSLPVDDPTMLEQLVRLPRTHLIVDGYNVTKNTWPSLSLDRQRELLLSGLGPLAARTGAEVTVVFDAAETQDRPLVSAPRNVRVRFSPYGVIADDVIRDLVAAEPTGRPLLVVTSDQAVVRDVVARGARVVGSAGLAALLSRSSR